MKKLFCVVGFCSIFNVYASDGLDKMISDDGLLERLTINKCSTFPSEKFDSKRRAFCLALLEKGVLKNKPYSNYILGQSLISGVNISKDEAKSDFFINKAITYNLKNEKKLTPIEVEYIIKARNFSIK